MRLAEQDRSAQVPAAPRAPRPSRFSLAWQRAVLTAFMVATRPIQALSSASASRFGSGLGRFACFVAVRQRRRANANLHLAYGEELNAAQRRDLTRRVFEHYGRSLVDFLRFPKMTVPEVDACVRCEGYEHIEAALAKGKGLIFVSGHLGNWEMLGRWGTMVRNLPLTVVAKDPRSPALAAYLKKMREGAGFTVLSMGVSAREILKTLRRGEIVCLLADQNSGDIFVPFFGIPAGTPQGPAALALHSGAALLPIHCLETGDGQFVIRCQPPIATTPTGDREADERRIMGEVNRILEGVIRQYPDQWLWLHNRWKSAFDPADRERAWGNSAESEAAYATARERWQV